MKKTLFKPDFDDDDVSITQRRNLQILIGVLGFLLPILLYFFLWVDTGYTKPLPSISHYYFTRVSSILVIVVSLLAFFLIIYKGFAMVDYILSTLAGIGALSLLLFPTGNISCCSPAYVCSVTTLPVGHPADFRVGLHYVSASVFLLCLAGLSFFVFTLTDESQTSITKEKKIRNVFFRVLGLTMLAAVVIAFVGQVGWIHIPIFGESLTFWMETIAVECFAFSWLIKAEVFFKDK